MKRAGGVLFALCLTLFSLGIAIFAVSYDTDSYHAFQQEHAIVEATGKNQDDLDKVNADIVRYLKTGEPILMTRNFGERECAHMTDVFSLFSLARVLCLLSAAGAAALLIFRKKERNPASASASLCSQAVVFVLLIILAFFAWTQWDTLFTTFHHIFFRNDLWLLNPETDLMIQMMPTPFFVGLAKGIAVRFIVLCLLGQGLWFLAGHRREEESWV